MAKQVLLLHVSQRKQSLSYRQGHLKSHAVIPV